MRSGAVIISDLGSVAGTWVNYTPISSTGVRLEDGDLVRIGKMSFRFQAAQGGETPRRNFRQLMVPSPSPHLAVAAITNPGRVRKQNEDRLKVTPFRTGLKQIPAILAVMADGIGGHPAGEVAAADGGGFHHPPRDPQPRRQPGENAHRMPSGLQATRSSTTGSNIPGSWGWAPPSPAP